MPAVLLIAEFARRHIDRQANWGRIIGLTSGGPLGFPTEVSYGAAKAALENYTMSAAFELAPWGITANLVYPPVTDTGWVNDSVREVVKQNPALIHIAQPEEVAEVITYLTCVRGSPLERPPDLPGSLTRPTGFHAWRWPDNGFWRPAAARLFSRSPSLVIG
jgi:NAD(P)-dependent dehydrogenase (short-subunit alcohol dehydrogenase family)